MNRFFTLLLLIAFSSVQAQSPGGYATNLYLWLKGGAGVTHSGGNVSVWANQASTSMVTQPSKTANANVTLVADGINFQPVLRYTGASSEMLSGKYTTTQTGAMLLFAVVKPNGGTSNLADPYSNGLEGSSGLVYDGTTGKYAIDFSGGSCSVSASYTGKAVIARASYTATANTLNAVTAINGVASTACSSFGLSAMDGNFQVGGRTYGFNVTRVFTGDIAEVIYYNGNTATATQIRQVESYLAFKYGIALGTTGSPINYVASNGTTTFWTANTTYQNDVYGIGTDNGSGLSTTSANSMNSGSGTGGGQSGKLNTTLSVPSALANQQFFVLGHDNGSLAEQTTNVPSGIAGAKRIGRTWKVQNTGSVGYLNLRFATAGLTFTGGTNANDYWLMINNNGTSNFTTGTQTYYYPTSIAGGFINFDGITINNGAVFTLVTKNIGVPLAVRFINFMAEARNADVALQWSVAPNAGTQHFTIERSTNGTSFVALGSVKADSSTQLYTYSDRQTGAGNVRYYRIKAVDKSGLFTYSVVKAVRMRASTSLQIQSARLVGHQLQATLVSAAHGSVQLLLYNSVGLLVGSWQNGLNEGVNNLTLNSKPLAAGLYILHCKMGDETAVLKLNKPAE